MLIKKSRFKARLIVAGALLVISILSSFLISAISNQRSSYWIANRELTPGQQIAASDLSLVQVQLSEISNSYMSSTTNLVGSIVINRIARKSLISLRSISAEISSINSAQISLNIRAIDLPIDTAPGDRISIYLVEDAQPGSFPTDPELILRDIYLGAITRKSSNFGSDVAIGISIGRDEISNVLRATTYGRLVIVQLNG